MIKARLPASRCEPVRSDEFKTAVDVVPRIYQVMVADVRDAISDLEQVERRIQTSEVTAREAVEVQ
jgi:hypothetical protein